MKLISKERIFGHAKLIGFCLKLYNGLNLKNRLLVGKGNKLNYHVAMLKNVKICIKGTNNRIIIEDFSRLLDCSIYIHGNNNLIFIGRRCYLYATEFYMEDSDNEISLGFHTSIDGKTQLAAIESTKINIGEDCMFSGNIDIRTGDSHSILNLQGERINPSQNVLIGNHCWIGTKVTCLKGTEIAHNSIVAASALLTKKYDQSNCVIGGVPAKVLKTGVEWKRERIGFRS